MIPKEPQRGLLNMTGRRNLYQIFYKIGVLKNFANFAGKHLYRSLFFAGRSITLLKKTLRNRCFSDEFYEIFKSTFYKEKPPMAVSR